MLFRSMTANKAGGRMEKDFWKKNEENENKVSERERVRESEREEIKKECMRTGWVECNMVSYQESLS